MKRHNFKNLQIWQEAIELIDQNYKLTAKFPDYERFGMRTQMNRCAVSIASNIAEGTSKSSNKHFIKYLNDALGSAFEWETQLIVCQRQNYIDENSYLKYEKRIQLIQRKISKFIDSLDKS